jgi:hypothetical protein
MGTNGFLPGLKLLESEALHSRSSNAEVKNSWRFTFIPPHLVLVQVKLLEI